MMDPNVAAIFTFMKTLDPHNQMVGKGEFATIRKFNKDIQKILERL